MKRTNKLLALFLALSVVLSLVCLPVSATGIKLEVAQGKNQNISVVFEDVAGVNGTISYSEEIFATVNGVLSKNVEGEVTKDKFYIYSDDAEEGNVSFVLNVRVNSNAKVGKTCVITFTYDSYDADGKVIAEDQEKIVTVKVVAGDSKVDYSYLEEQIALAEVLVEKDYTAETWSVLANALTAAKSARTSNNQAVVDAAAAALEAARLGLIKLDYSALIAALAAVDTFYAEDELTGILKQFVEAVMLGTDLLENGGSQADIDATAAKILELLDALKKALDNAGDIQYVEVPVPGATETVIVEKTVQVEVEVPVQNNLWLILFIITAILLVAAVAFLVVKYLQDRDNNG